MSEGIKAPYLQKDIWNRLFIGGAALPGIVQSVRLGGALKMDRETVSGQSGVVITDANWSEDSAEFSLIVPSYELKRFNEFRSKYKGSAGEKPQPVEVGHPLLSAFGIKKMLISGIDIDWNNTQKDHVPIVIKLTNINPKPTRSGATNPDGTARPSVNSPTGVTKSDAITNPPTSLKPGDKGTTESNAVAGQPKPLSPAIPTLPDAKRKG
jgi:hypothetical protein